MKLQLLMDIDLGVETSPSEIVDAFNEAIHQVAYAYGNAGSWKYLGDIAGSWRPRQRTRLVNAEGKSWWSTAMLAQDNNENMREVKQ